MSAGPTIGVALDRWALVEHPLELAGKAVPACHDETPFVTILCPCGYGMHVHESQLEDIPEGDELATNCLRCRKELFVPVDFVRSTILETWGA